MNTPRRKFSKDSRLEAVKMVTDGSLSKSEVARNSADRFIFNPIFNVYNLISGTKEIDLL